MIFREHKKDVSNKNKEEESSFSPLGIVVRSFQFIRNLRDELGLIFLGAFFFFVATNTQSGWLYFVIAIIFGFLVFALIQNFYNMRGIRIVRKFVETCKEDDLIFVTLSIFNDSAFPKYMLVVQDSFPTRHPNEKDEKILVPFIPRKSKIDISYEARCFRRGIHHFGKVSIESAGLLGLFFMKKLITAEPDRLVVFPRTYRLDHFLLDNISPYYSREEKTYMFTGRSHDFMGIREYAPGHEIRFIHWPSTAKTGKFMVKEFKEIATHSLSVIIDTDERANFGTGRDTTGEDMFRTAATLLVAAKQRRYTYDLYSRNGENFLVDKNISSKKGLFRLAELNCNSPHSIEDDLREIARHVEPLDHIFFLRTLPFRNLDSLREIIEKRVFITVIFYNPRSYINGNIEDLAFLEKLDYENQTKELQKLGITVYIYNKGDSLNSMLSFRRRAGVSASH